MCNIIRLFLCVLTLWYATSLHANTTDPVHAEHCPPPSQPSQSDTASQQQLQPQCASQQPTARPAAQVIPVQLDVTLPPTAQPKPGVPQPSVQAAGASVQRVQHNSTLETLGSSMLLILVGFWLWMGRK